LSAVSRPSEFIEAVMIALGIGFDVELLVAAVSGADTCIFAQDFNPAPIEGIKPHLDELTSRVKGRFPELAFRAKGGIQAHPALDAVQESSSAPKQGTNRRCHRLTRKVETGDSQRPL
jgi:hypothetical protein